MKNSLLIKTLFLLFIIGIPQSVIFAQDTLSTKDTLDVYEMSLEQLLNIKAHGVSSELEKLVNSLIGVASKKPLSSRESPSIVSLITEEEIKKSGARDLIDVLQLVPGIDFGVDVYGVVGIGMRGNWSNEGKVLMLLDGQETNDILYGTHQFGNHFPVDQIKKIEIIRGPGSAIYGGYAEYGVINIITKGAEDLNGVSVTGTYGQMKNAYGRRNINLSGGGKIGDVAMSLSAFMGQGNRSDQDYKDVFGTTYNMAGNSNLNPSNVNLGLSYKGLSFRGIIDDYKTTLKDGYGEVGKSLYYQNFESYFAELKYTYKAGEKLTITPRINYKHQLPWSTPTSNNVDDFQKVTDRYTGNLTLSYDFTRKINFIAGAEVFRDHAQDNVDGSYFLDNKKTVSYINQAFFTQGLIKHRIVNIILGARLDKHNDYGSAFVPRIGLTKKINKLHLKLLYSKAFRAPAIENISQQDSTGMKPEKTEVIELEAGYQLTRKSMLTINFFDITTKDPIVYYHNEVNNLDRYHNLKMSGSNGIELEYRLKDTWGYLNVSYSFYTVAGKGKALSYEVSENEKVLLAFPAHKINVNSNIIISKHLNVNPSLSYRSERYGYTSVDTISGNAILEEFKPVLLANIFVTYTNLFTKGLTIGAGVYDILDVKYKFIQPYNSKHAPLPGPSRELVIKLSYDFNFKDKNKS